MLFSEDTRELFKKREEEWLNEIKKAGAEGIKSTNMSGFGLKPVYTLSDLEGLNREDLAALPGQYPYTRGSHNLHYQVALPMMAQQMSHGGGKETRERREFSEKLGRRLRIGAEDDSFAMVLAVDLPTQTGFDADDPEAEGKVGECAVSMCIIDEIAEAFEGTSTLENIAMAVTGFNAMEVLAAMYAVYAMDIRKEPLEKIIMLPVSEHHCQYYYDIATYPPQAGLRLKAELIKWVVENCARSSSYLIDGYNVGETGAVPPFEMALAFSEAFATADECVKIGLDPDDFLPSFWTHFHLGMNIFEEVAKLRAGRRVWAKMVKERYGCTNPSALTMKGFAADQASGYETVALEPLNNVIRNTIMCLSGLLANVDGVHPIAYDEPLGIPTDESLKISLRTMQILLEETDIPYVSDPLGGSYYVEWLTSKMEEGIFNYMKKIDDMGGFIKCYETGWIRAEVARQAHERMKRLASGDSTKVGFNKYKVEESAPPMKVMRRPIELEKRVIERVKKFKRERDVDKTKAALGELRKAAEAVEKEWPSSAGCLMPAIIEAVRAKASLGECCRVFREVFGYGYYAG